MTTGEDNNQTHFKNNNDKKLLIKMLWISVIFFGSVAALMYLPESIKWMVSPITLLSSAWVLFKN